MLLMYWSVLKELTTSPVDGATEGLGVNGSASSSKLLTVVKLQVAADLRAPRLSQSTCQCHHKKVNSYINMCFILIMSWDYRKLELINYQQHQHDNININNLEHLTAKVTAKLRAPYCTLHPR